MNKQVETVLKMDKIIKEFSSVRVLKEVNFELRKGEVHALVGANGAGKSTLMKILNGIYVNYGGEIILNGSPVKLHSPRDAFENGVAMIHQELDLVGNLDVSENIFLGQEIMKNSFPSINRAAMRQKAQELLDSLEFEIDATDLVEKLPPAQQQLVLIARIVALNAKVVVMDEPTSSLSINEIEKLFDVIKGLCEKGISVIYISHFLEEIFRISDRVTVLRDGGNVTTVDVKDCTKQQLVEWMVGEGAEVGKNYIRENRSDEVVLSVKGLSQKRGIVKDITFDLKKGEVLGLAGVVGSGRTELLKMIFGAIEKSSGTMEICGKAVTINSPLQAVAQNIALIPEDRKTEGVVLIRSINQNIALSGLKQNSKYGAIDDKKVKSIVEKMINELKLKCSSQDQEVRFLSGGNQQKVVIGKWLSVGSKIIIMDQPTRGIDVGAKKEIYDLIDRLAKEGTSILLASDEMEEVLGLCDRVLVMKKGRIVGELDNSDLLLTKTDLLTTMVSDETTHGKVVI